MTPMRKTFVEVERLLHYGTPEHHLEKCNELFLALLNFARDAEEAGEAAMFVSTALIYLHDGLRGSPTMRSKLKDDLSNRGQALAAVMLTRRGQVKNTQQDGGLLPFTDRERRFLNRASEAGVLVFKPRDDAMVVELTTCGLLKSEVDPNPDYELMTLTAGGYEALAANRRAS